MLFSSLLSVISASSNPRLPMNSNNYMLGNNSNLFSGSRSPALPLFPSSNRCTPCTPVVPCTPCVPVAPCTPCTPCCDLSGQFVSLIGMYRDNCTGTFAIDYSVNSSMGDGTLWLMSNGTLDESTWRWHTELLKGQFKTGERILVTDDNRFEPGYFYCLRLSKGSETWYSRALRYDGEKFYPVLR